jgi:predicted Zn finger-like uncharacterized protein
MEIRCEECHAVIQIPDERVPQSGAFRLSCPRCKRKILAGTKTTEGPSEGKTNLALSSCPSEVTPLVDGDPDEDLHEMLSSLQPGQSAALLCVNQGEVRDQLKAMFEGMDYVVDIPAAAGNALQRLRFNQYHVVVLDDDFEGKSAHSVAAYLAGLNMNIRREMFVVSIGQRFKTADHLQAFMESANLILHPDDLPRLSTFLTRGMRDQELFYKVFTECLFEVGKKI